MSAHSLHESIPHAPDAEDVNRTGGIVLDLLPQMGDMWVDGPVGDDGLSPRFVEDLIPRHDLAPARDQKLEQMEFQSGQVQLLPLLVDFMAFEVDRDIAELEYLLRISS